MKKMQACSIPEETSAEMRSEYRLDYRQARPNRFAGRSQEGRLVVVLDEDIAQVFQTPESVNEVLRALIRTMPPVNRSKAAVEQ
ncbi:MAG: hypothetical protein JW934_09845 [Anaerolineae bacterium]|nr:hypothetical protein [Anaerolineae bacterium]